MLAKARLLKLEKLRGVRFIGSSNFSSCQRLLEQMLLEQMLLEQMLLEQMLLEQMLLEQMLLEQMLLPKTNVA
jgi:predicted oxidoreductase